VSRVLVVVVVVVVVIYSKLLVFVCLSLSLPSFFLGFGLDLQIGGILASRE